MWQQASREPTALDPRNEVTAAFIVLVTYLPRQAHPAHEVLAAYRLRWQIDPPAGSG